MTYKLSKVIFFDEQPGFYFLMTTFRDNVPEDISTSKKCHQNC